MTVENTQNKMPPLQMGTTNEYPFTFAVLLQDPTAEEALEAIKASVLQADGTEIELVYNTDYTVTLNTDRIGGTLTVNDIRTSSDYITIYRQYAQTQEVDYKDFNSAPAETFEQCFDKLTMLSQQQQEEINRSLKLNVSSTIIDPSLPEPIANNTLIWDSVGSSLKNYDIIGENNQFKAEVNAAIIAGQADIQAQLDKFENVINSEIEDVREAAEKINELEQAVDDAQTAANIAEASASDASQAAISATQAAQNAQTTLNTRANIDLSNLSSVGENKFNTILNNKITNCLLEVPQNIKLELNNGTLTLKAGSIVTVPNGFEADGTTPKFDYVTIESDVTGSQWGTVTDSNIFEIYNPITNEITPWEHSYSGSTAPTQTFCIWYDTTNNLVKLTTDGGAYWESGMALPLSRSNYSNGFIASIEQVFNGFGYIGSVIWIDKGVKGLIPNGRNEDGTLKNIEVTSSKLTTQSYTNNAHIFFGLTENGDATLNEQYSYDELNNFAYNSNAVWLVAVCGTYDIVDGKINNYQPKPPVNLVRHDELVDISEAGVGFPSNRFINLSYGGHASNYTAPANGYFVIHGYGSTANIWLINHVSGLDNSVEGNSDIESIGGIFLPCRKGDVIQAGYYGGTVTLFRFIYAEGEI